MARRLTKDKVQPVSKQINVMAWGQAVRLGAVQIHRQLERRFGKAFSPQQADAPRLDKPPYLRWAAGYQPIGLGSQQDVVIRDQGCSKCHQLQRQRGFAAAGRAKDDKPAPLQGNTTGVKQQLARCGSRDRRSRTARPGHTGRPTTNRAPNGSEVMSAWVGRMFSAQITPPCASTICFEIAKPRPE